MKVQHVIYHWVMTIIAQMKLLLVGTLHWSKVTGGYPRTEARFTLSLQLSTSYYGNVTVGGQVTAPGKFMFGDETDMTGIVLTVWNNSL